MLLTLLIAQAVADSPQLNSCQAESCWTTDISLMQGLLKTTKKTNAADSNLQGSAQDDVSLDQSERVWTSPFSSNIFGSSGTGSESETETKSEPEVKADAPSVKLKQLDLDMVRIMAAAYDSPPPDKVPTVLNGRSVLGCKDGTRAFEKNCTENLLWLGMDSTENWNLEGFYDDLDDSFAIYAKNGTIVLAFRGSNSADDAKSDLMATAIPFCGLQVNGSDVLAHQGFVTELRKLLMALKLRPKLHRMLQGSSGIIVVGHSLGGAMASLLAACANHPDPTYRASKDPDTHKAVEDITVKAIYTIGAPSISRVQLTNHGQMFPGRRFYNYDSLQYDPVPSSAQAANHKHPLLQAVRLVKRCNTLGTKCDPTKAEIFHSYDATFARTPLILKGFPRPSLHSCAEYEMRIQSVLRRALSKN